MKRWASLLVLLTVLAGLPPAPAQSIVPKVEMTIAPELAEVNVSAAGANAIFQCTVFVEGMPYVRYRVNLTAQCEDWQAACSPNTFQVTETANNSFTVTVTVPSGQVGGVSHQVNVTAVVSATGLPLANTTVYATVLTKQAYGVDLFSDAGALSADAGKQASWVIGVRNLGNGQDYISLSVVDSKTLTSVGWSLRFNRSTVWMASMVSMSVALNITPPADAEDQTVTIQVRGYSKNAYSHNLTSEDKVEVNFTVRKVVKPPDGKKNPSPKGPIPGLEAAALVPALLVLAALARRSKKWSS